MAPKESIAFMSLGSNCAHAEQMLRRAARCVDALYGCRIVQASPVYLTEPQGYASQPWFANQVIMLAVAGWRPADLLDCMLNMERRLGRTRGNAPRFGPRTIDMDLLLFDNVKCEDPNCALPHPRMLQRAFVLKPLLDLVPDLLVNGVSARAALAGLNWHEEHGRIYQT